MSVALSADGSTAIVGGPGPHNADLGRSPFVGPAGAAWVFMRSYGVWTQQGNKLVGTTNECGGGLWSQGASVALSADGNTAIVGGPSDNKTMGAAWVFTRTSGVWTQQGSKLIGTDAHRMGDLPSPTGQGMAVALSADGNTAIVGGWGAEGVWVFTRNGSGVWTQEGKKLVGEGAVGRARRGMSLALSADGNTAIVGGWSDNGKTGAAWVFSRSGGVWAQQGKKLVGSGAVGSASQGWSVALSADGSTAIVGGPGDNLWHPLVPFGLGAAGAAWVFTRNGSGWTQEGEKLVRPEALAKAHPLRYPPTATSPSWAGLWRMVGGAGLVFTRSGGHWTLDNKLVGTSAVGKSAPSLGLSADGSVAMIGGFNDNGGIGAVWVFAHSGGGWSEDKKLIGTGAMGKSIPSSGCPQTPVDEARSSASSQRPSGSCDPMTTSLMPLARSRGLVERAQQPDFFHREGPGRILEGAIARRAHYRWAGIPRELLKEWTTHRRRRVKTICELETASPAGASGLKNPRRQGARGRELTRRIGERRTLARRRSARKPNAVSHAAHFCTRSRMRSPSATSSARAPCTSGLSRAAAAIFSTRRI